MHSGQVPRNVAHLFRPRPTPLHTAFPVAPPPSPLLFLGLRRPACRQAGLPPLCLCLCFCLCSLPVHGRGPCLCFYLRVFSRRRLCLCSPGRGITPGAFHPTLHSTPPSSQCHPERSEGSAFAFVACPFRGGAFAFVSAFVSAFVFAFAFLGTAAACRRFAFPSSSTGTPAYAPLLSPLLSPLPFAVILRRFAAEACLPAGRDLPSRSSTRGFCLPPYSL